MDKTCESTKWFGKGSDGETMHELLEQFIQDSGQRALHFALKLSENVEEAKDLVQEALYRVIRHWDRYDASRPLDTWIFVVMRNLFIQRKRSYCRKHVVSLDCPLDADSESTYQDLIPEHEASVLDRLERRESILQVRDAMACLSQGYQEVLALCDMAEMKYDEAARTLGMPVGTLRSRLFRARKSLRKQAGLRGLVK